MLPNLPPVSSLDPATQDQLDRMEAKLDLLISTIGADQVLMEAKRLRQQEERCLRSATTEFLRGING